MAANIAVELGIPDRLWHEHGGWRSVQAAQGYVVTSRDLKLKTTRSMLRVLSDGGLPAGAHGPPPPFVHSPRREGCQDENVQVPQRGTRVLGQYRNMSRLKAWMRGEG